MESCCAICAYFSGGACRVYKDEPISAPRATTCNEFRAAKGSWTVEDREVPEPSMGVYEEKASRDGKPVLKFRVPRRKKGESDLAYGVRLGGLFRFNVRLGGQDELARALRELGRLSVREFERSLDAHPQARLHAAESLGQLAGARALHALRARLEQETDPATRTALVLSLARLGDRKALEVAETIGGDELAAKGAKAIVPALLELDAQALRRLAPDERQRSLVVVRLQNRGEAALLAWASMLLAGDAPPELQACAHEALELAGKGTDAPDVLARLAFRVNAPAPAASDALAVALLLPSLVARGPEARTLLLGEVAAAAQAPPTRVAAAIAASSLVASVLEVEPPLAANAAVARAAEAAQPVHGGFASALARWSAGSKNFAATLGAAAEADSLEKALGASVGAPVPARAAAAFLGAARGGLTALPPTLLGHAAATAVAAVVDRRPARR